MNRIEVYLFKKCTHTSVPWPEAMRRRTAGGDRARLAGRKATSARQARALKALKRADDTAIAEIGGLLYEVPRGAAGARVIGQITRHQLYGSDFSGSDSDPDSDDEFDRRGAASPAARMLI